MKEIKKLIKMTETFKNTLLSQQVGLKKQVFLWKILVSQILFLVKLTMILTLNLLLEIVKQINGAQETVVLLK